MQKTLVVTFVCDFLKKVEKLYLVYFVIFPKTIIAVFLYILIYNNIIWKPYNSLSIMVELQ